MRKFIGTMLLVALAAQFFGSVAVDTLTGAKAARLAAIDSTVNAASN